MIRLFLLSAGFLSVTIALVVSQMRDDAEDTAAEVTRADTSAALSLHDTSALSPVDRPVAVARGDAEAGALSVDMLTQTILTELRRPVTGDRLRLVASSTGGNQTDMRSLTEGVLAGLGSADAAPEAVPAAIDRGAPQSLNALIVQAMRDGQSDAYVDALLNEALGRGNVAVPEAIVTSSGTVDTATLLDSLVYQSTNAPQDTPEPAPAKIAIPLLETAPADTGPLRYVVQPGDSLAGIALRHFGTTTAYEIIYRANRDQLPSPSAVRPGMELIIPTL